MAKDPYKLLGVPKGAAEADIRKAYRALAKKLHPDVNPGNEKAANRFKEITAAYTLLTDKKLRAQYDSGKVDASGQQQNPFGGGFGGQGFGGFQNAGFGGRAGGHDDMADLFSSLFGMNMGAQTGGPQRQGYGQARARQQPKNGSDIRYKLSLTFLEALKGGKKRIKTKSGEGVNVTIPEGVVDGAVLRLRGKGHAGVAGGRAGDAKVEISVKAHKYYSRDGQNLRLTLPITLKEAILGAKVTLPMPSGSVSLNIPAGTNSGKTMRLKGKGINGGDLLVTPQITLIDPADVDLKTWAETAAEVGSGDIRDVLTS